MKIVRCIENGCGYKITKGREYGVIKDGENYYTIIADDGCRYSCSKNLFEEVTPHIVLTPVGFEEMDVFKLRAYNDTTKYRINKGKLELFYEVRNEWQVCCRDVDEVTVDITLIQEPTEVEKLEQKMKDMAVKHKAEMDAMAEELRGLNNSSNN